MMIKLFNFVHSHLDNDLFSKGLAKQSHTGFCHTAVVYKIKSHKEENYFFICSIHSKY